MTRHGAGPLPFECSRRDLPGVLPDGTNVANPWQGEFRYARHESVKRFMQPLLQDVSAAGIMPSLAVTHLDETGDTMFFQDAAMTFADFCRLVKPYFHRIYASRDRCSAAPVDA